MPRKKLERRSYFCEVRAEENGSGSVLTGRPIVYNSMTDMGWFDEIIEAGALNNTDLTDVRFLVNHNTSNIPLARSRRNTPNSTMQLMPDQQGLSIRVNLDTENNAEAKSLYSAVQRGDISGMSFMFSIDDEEWENMESDHPIRHIRAIGTVVEVSAVTFPAYEATEIYARSKEALESAKKALENAREGRASDTSSVDTELQLLQMRSKSIFLKGGK
jgi:HK97 family phage prohead protease